MNHLKTGKNREEVKCEESLIYRVDVLRNSASNVDRLPQIMTLRSLQIIRYEVLYLKTRLIIISFQNILLWHLFLALSKLDFFSKMPFSTKFLRFPPWLPPLVDAILNLALSSWDSKSWRMRVRDSVLLKILSMRVLTSPNL